MKTVLSFLILFSVVIINAEPQKLCSNGVFKCVSSTSLRICFNDKLVTSEFFCPNSTFCNENSPTICTKIPAALPAIQYYEESVTTDENVQCTESGAFAVENTGCTTYLNCSNLEEECDDVSLFDPEKKTCSEDYICPELLEYIESYDDCSGSNTPFICPKVGNFPMSNTNCTKFIYCKRINIGLKPIPKYCSSNTLFDPRAGKCVKGYVCEDKCTTISDSTTTTQFDFSTTIQATTLEDIPECTDTGKFPLPNTNCTMYRLCVNTINGFVYKDYSCPIGSYFNPSTSKCSTTYECWPHITTPVSSTTDDFSTTNNQPTYSSSSTSPIMSTTIVSSENTQTHPDDTTTSIIINETIATTTERDVEDNSSSISTYVPSTSISDETTAPSTDAHDTTTSLNLNTTDDIFPSSTKDTNSTDFPINTPSSTAFDDITDNPTDSQDSTTSSNLNTTNKDVTDVTDDMNSNSSTVSTTTFEETTLNSTNTLSTLYPNTTEKNVSDDVSSSTTRDPNSTDATTLSSAFSNETIPNSSTDDQDTTTALNPSSEKEITDLPITTPNTTVSNEATPNSTNSQDTTTSSNETTPNSTNDQDTTTSSYPNTEKEVTDLPNSTPNTTASNEVTPNSTNGQDTTTPTYPSTSTTQTPTNSSTTQTPTNPSTTQKDVTDDTSLSPTKNTNSTDVPTLSTAPSNETTPNSTDDQDSTETTTDIHINATASSETSSNSTNGLSTTTSDNPSTTQKDLTDDTSTVTTSKTTAFEETTANSTGTDEETTTKSNGGTNSATPHSTKDSITELTTFTMTSNATTQENKETTSISTTNTEENELTTSSIDCRSQGRLPILNTKCRLYYQCTLTTNGYQYKTYECSNGTLFDPNTKICSNLYICPEMVTSTTTDKTITDPQESTTIEDSTTDSDEITIDLNCTQQGKVPIPNKSCQLYGQCVLTTNGFIQTIYECPKGSLYDPKLKICSSSYICPETISESTTDKIITTTIKDYSSTNLDELSSTNSPSTSVSLSLSTETQSPSPIIPSCTEPGKFPILNTKCKNYISCTLTTTGYKSTEYACSGNLLFDPNLKKCSSNYICKEEFAIFPKHQVTESTDEEECISKGKFILPGTGCTKYKLCVQTSIGFQSKIYSCPINTLFDWETSRCSRNYSCPETSEEGELVSETTTSTMKPELGDCTESGKFPVPDSKCSQYILCVSTPNGYLSKIYTCPSNSVFNPETKKCSNTYSCFELDTTTNPDLETTTEVFNSKELDTEVPPRMTPDLDIPECHTSGKFSIDNTGCSKYILCSLTTTGFKSKIYSCPIDSFFNPDLKRCQKEFICPELSTTTEDFSSKELDSTTNTEVPTKMTPDLEIPECHTSGKFSIDNTGCSKYILCSLTTTGFKSKIYSCPIDSFFNPDLKRCQKEFICPELSTTTEAFSSEESFEDCIDVLKEIPVCTSTGKFPVIGTSCKQYILCTQTSLGFRSKIYNCPNDSNFDPNKNKCMISYNCSEKICNIENKTKAVKMIKKPTTNKCKSPGKFSIKGSNCKKFKLCVRTNSGYNKAIYDCPKGTYFNPRLKLCSANYICMENNLQNCSTIGQFEDGSDSTCRYYINCKANSEGVVRGRRQICHDDYFFDPVIQKCSANYMCKEKKLAKAMTKASTCLINDQCTTIGRYTICGTSCKNYMYCADNGDGTLKGTRFTCPTTTVFNQAIQKCATNYICPNSDCNFLGKRPNPNSKDCTSYIICEEIYDPITGLVVGSKELVVSCPLGQKFDPFNQCCSFTYVCRL